MVLDYKVVFFFLILVHFFFFKRKDHMAFSFYDGITKTYDLKKSFRYSLYS